MRTAAMSLLVIAALNLCPIGATASSMAKTNLNQAMYLNTQNRVGKYNSFPPHLSTGSTLFGKIIAIDPGHGGSDTGAIGPSGIMEKDVTLAIGQDLKALLTKDGVKVIMTRTKDQDVYGPFASPEQELQARVDIANQSNADLFISVHVDSCDDNSVGGTTTYYFEETGKADQLARYVENGLDAQLHLDNRGERSDNFYVLENTSMPAILTEVAYVSNPTEEKLVAKNVFRQKAAIGIYNGIKTYFSQQGK